MSAVCIPVCKVSSLGGGGCGYSLQIENLILQNTLPVFVSAAHNYQSSLSVATQFSYNLNYIHRLCGHIHVLYKAVNMCLRSSNITPAEEIDPTHVSATGSGCEETDSIPEFPEEEEIPELPPPVGGESSGTQKPSMDGPSMLITEEEARMAVALTEYFQEQRKAYEQVCICVNVILH